MRQRAVEITLYYIPFNSISRNIVWIGSGRDMKNEREYYVSASSLSRLVKLLPFTVQDFYPGDMRYSGDMLSLLDASEAGMSVEEVMTAIEREDRSQYMTLLWREGNK